MVDNIRHLLFNILLNHALNRNFTFIDVLNEDILIKDTILTLVKEKELCYLSGEKIIDIPIEFQSLFIDFSILRKAHYENFDFLLQDMILKIKKRQYFKSELIHVNRFLVDALGKITKEHIQQHFYNGIADELLTTNLIPINDIKSREPYIYLAVTSLVIIKTVIRSQSLTNGFFSYVEKSIINETNCPLEYQLFFKSLQEIKSKFIQINPNIDLIRLYCLTNPDLEIPDILLKYKTSDLMHIVSMISSIAIQVSSMYDFKLLIENVFLLF